jgi:hypothetical protein
MHICLYLKEGGGVQSPFQTSRIFQEFPDFRFFPGFSENCKLLWPGCKVREGFCKVSKAVKVKEGFVKVGKG